MADWDHDPRVRTNQGSDRSGSGYVEVHDLDSDWRRVAKVGPDGNFHFSLDDAPLSGTDVLRLEAPSFTVEDTLDSLTSAPVTEPARQR